jgi:hypothetical protein
MCRKDVRQCLFFSRRRGWQLTEDVQEGCETKFLLFLEGEAGYLLRMCRKDVRKCLLSRRERLATY